MELPLSFHVHKMNIMFYNAYCGNLTKKIVDCNMMFFSTIKLHREEKAPAGRSDKIMIYIRKNLNAENFSQAVGGIREI